MRVYTSFLSVVFCIVFFSFKTNCFFAKTRDGFEGVQRRGPVKGAVCPRSSKTLEREHRWNNAGFRRRGLRGRKNRKGAVTSTKNSESREAADRRVARVLLIDSGA
jgi:hypothetical protein